MRRLFVLNKVFRISELRTQFCITLTEDQAKTLVELAYYGTETYAKMGSGIRKNEKYLKEIFEIIRVNVIPELEKLKKIRQENELI